VAAIDAGTANGLPCTPSWLATSAGVGQRRVHGQLTPSRHAKPRRPASACVAQAAKAVKAVKAANATSTKLPAQVTSKAAASQAIKKPSPLDRPPAGGARLQPGQGAELPVQTQRETASTSAARQFSCASPCHRQTRAWNWNRVQSPARHFVRQCRPSRQESGSSGCTCRTTIVSRLHGCHSTPRPSSQQSRPPQTPFLQAASSRAGCSGCAVATAGTAPAKPQDKPEPERATRATRATRAGRLLYGSPPQGAQSCEMAHSNGSTRTTNDSTKRLRADGLPKVSFMAHVWLTAPGHFQSFKRRQIHVGSNRCQATADIAA